MRTTMLALCILMTTVSSVTAQDRGVSIPDVYTPDSADAFAAQEVTAALRIAGGMMPEWRLSTVDVPLVELMRACGASSDTSASEECMAAMVLTRDPSMTGGFILFAFMERVGEANGYRLVLALYDMRERRIANRIEAAVERIMAPAARNRLAADWIRELLAPPRVEVAETRPTETSDADTSTASSDAVEADEPPTSLPRDVPIEPPRLATDFTATDSIGLALVGLGIASAIAAGITGGLVLSMNGDERYNAYRRNWDAEVVADVCRVAETDPSPEARYALGVCNDAETLEITGHVLWAVSGLLAVTGALTFLIPHALGSSAPATEVAILPTVGPTRAGLDLRVTF